MLTFDFRSSRFRGPFLESPDNQRARKAVLVYIQDGSLNSFSDKMIELYNLFVSGNLCFYLLNFYFGLEKHSRNGPQFIDLDKAKSERA